MTNLEIAGVCARSGANCGSIFLDLRFCELVKTLLADHPVHLDAASLAYFMHTFSKTDKLAYMGESDDGMSYSSKHAFYSILFANRFVDNMFNFTTSSVEDPHDPSVGLINGELAIPGNLLRREVFDPVVSQVLDFCCSQVGLFNFTLLLLLNVLDAQFFPEPIAYITLFVMSLFSTFIQQLRAVFCKIEKSLRLPTL